MRVTCNESGYLKLGASSGSPTSISDGTNLDSAQISIKGTLAKAKGFEDVVANRKVVEFDISISAEQYATSGDGGGYAALGGDVYATFTDVTGTVLFAGNAVVTDSGANPQVNNYGKRRISIEANGLPDTCPALDIS